MADYSDSKGPTGAVWPDNAVEGTGNYLEPLLRASQLRERYLFGLPLVSQIKDPITKKNQQVTDALLNDLIAGAVSQVETDFRIDIMPVKRKEKYPYDRNEYDSWGFFKLHHVPVATVDKLTITPANGLDVYEIPKDWIETAHIITGQVNIVPIGIGSVYQGLLSSAPVGGAWFLSVLSVAGWLPAYWQFEYTTGFPNGQVPRVVNDMIGCLAAIEVLGMMGATYAKVTSSSLGADGLSQSVATPGPNLFQPRIEMLQNKYDRLGKRLKGQFGQKIWSDTI